MPFQVLVCFVMSIQQKLQRIALNRARYSKLNKTVKRSAKEDEEK